MLNLNNDIFNKLKELYDVDDMETSALNIRKKFIDENGEFSVFNLFKAMNSMVILHEDKDTYFTRFITFKSSERANYMILGAKRNVEEMRFDAACMLRTILKKIVSSKSSNLSINHSVQENTFSREDKHFACALLMPEKELMRFVLQKDENGKHKYLSENGEISLKNINVIADHFGVPYGQCSSRVFHVFEKLRKENRGNYYIEGCYTKSQYKEMKNEYVATQLIKDREEVCPDYKKHSSIRRNHLLDCLHYRSYSKLTDVAKGRLLINLAKFDSVNEKVVKDEEEAKKIIKDFIASGGVIKGGKLITNKGETELTNEQMVVLGEYTLYKSALARGLIKGIAKSNPDLAHISKLSYKEALECISERQLSNYICDLHRRMYKFLSEKQGENVGGFYRNYPVRLAGTMVAPAEYRMIGMLMENVCWKILNILKKNANGELSNSQYIDEINECIREMIRMQPFGDGNKRTSRLLSNILYQEKGLPFVLLPVSAWKEYVEAWSDDSMEKYNDLMHRLIFESYGYFYGSQSVNEAINPKIKSEKIITANVGR